VPGYGVGYGWRLLFGISHLGFDSREGRRAQAPFPAVHGRTKCLDVLLDFCLPVMAWAAKIRSCLVHYERLRAAIATMRSIAATSGRACFMMLMTATHSARSLRAGCARVPMRRIRFCAMPNHFPLAIWPYEDGDLTVWMHWLVINYAHGYYKRYRGSGHLWQGRFMAAFVQPLARSPCWGPTA